jgi:c-di-GMP-binding flagellar brake protein YcgR
MEVQRRAAFRTSAPASIASLSLPFGVNKKQHIISVGDRFNKKNS